MIRRDGGVDADLDPHRRRAERRVTNFLRSLIVVLHEGSSRPKR
jgi:hypothetical protein